MAERVVLGEVDIIAMKKRLLKQIIQTREIEKVYGCCFRTAAERKNVKKIGILTILFQKLRCGITGVCNQQKTRDDGL